MSSDQQNLVMNGWKLSNTALHIVAIQLPPSQHRFLKHLHERKGEEWITGDLQMSADVTDIITCIGLGTENGVSDGSFKDIFGTASWVIENVSGT